MPVGTLTYLSGSQSLTGSFGRIYAITDSIISVSGSSLGQATFLLKAGTNFESLTTSAINGGTFIENNIQYININNTYGFILAQQVATTT